MATDLSKKRTWTVVIHHFLYPVQPTKGSSNWESRAVEPCHNVPLLEHLSTLRFSSSKGMDGVYQLLRRNCS